MPKIRFLNSYDGEFISHEMGELQRLRYSVLSHTWRENEEVTYSEWNNRAHRPWVSNKAGYHKVEDFMDLSLRKGFKFCWSDTCCIQKRDPEELKVTIGLMFRLYESADICYVYLDDFRGDSISIRQDGGTAFKKSRWFTRGWTLQELIGPATVHFYNSTWSYIGSKHSLARIIAEETGIPITLLKGEENLHDFSCAQKMSWAVGRDTKEPADRAYSLMGLFGVKIDPNYSDGIHAFRHLQERILKEHNDESIFAWKQFGPWLPQNGHVLGRHPVCSMFAPSPDCFRSAQNIHTGINENALPLVDVGAGDIRSGDYRPMPVRRISNTHISVQHNRLQVRCYVRRLHKFVHSQNNMVLLEAMLQCYDSTTEPYGLSVLVAADHSSFKSCNANGTVLEASRVEPYILFDANFSAKSWLGYHSHAKDWHQMALSLSPTWPDERRGEIWDRREEPWERDHCSRQEISEERVQKITDNFNRNFTKANTIRATKPWIFLTAGIASVFGIRHFYRKYKNELLASLTRQVISQAMEERAISYEEEEEEEEEEVDIQH